MIPEQTLVDFPEFADAGQKTQPESAKYSNGFLPDDTLPAQYANWLFNKASAGITTINRGMESIEAELVSILTAAGIEPSEATNNQVKTAVQQLINTAASEAETNAKNLANATGTLAASHGGTGQTSLQATRNAMGLGNTTGALPVANGGTGATTAAGARNALGLGNTTGALPIANGGTGQTSVAAARNALGLGNTTGALPIANGGTGQTTAAAARNALGLGNTTGALPIANGGTGATTAAGAKTNLGLGNVTNEAYPLPVGFIYTQYPGEKSPSELGLSGTWTDITKKFAGLFFRAEGGNAKGFDTCSYEIKTVGSKAVTLKKTPTGISNGDTVILINDNDHSVDKKITVTQVNGDVLNFSETIPSNLTTVLITQHEGVPNINGSISLPHPINAHSSTGKAFTRQDTSFSRATLNYTEYSFYHTDAQFTFNASQGEQKIDGTIKNDVYGKQDHVTPENISIKIWKRTA